MNTLRAGMILLAALMIAPAWAQTDADDLAAQWTRAYNSHDRVALGGLYSQSAELMLHGRPRITGRANIEQYWARDFGEGNPLTSLHVTHTIEGADMILVHGDYQVIDRDIGIRLGFGRFAHIWTLQDDGSWRLDRDLWHEPVEPTEIFVN